MPIVSTCNSSDQLMKSKQTYILNIFCLPSQMRNNLSLCDNSQIIVNVNFSQVELTKFAYSTQKTIFLSIICLESLWILSNRYSWKIKKSLFDVSIYTDWVTLILVHFFNLAFIVGFNKVLSCFLGPFAFEDTYFSWKEYLLKIFDLAL